MSLFRPVLVCFAVGPLVIAQSRPLGAQGTVELGPILGYYSPSPSPMAHDGPNAPGNFSGLAVGGEFVLWTPRVFGVRADYMVAGRWRSETTNPGGFQPALSGHVTIASLLAAFDLTPSHSHRLWLGAGPGYIEHAGAAFDQSGNPTDFAGIAAFGSTVALGDALCLSFAGSAVLYRYAGVYGVVGGFPGYQAPYIYARRFQHDGIVHVVLAWTPRSRR